MVHRHPRTPAAVILTAAAALSLLYVASYGRIVRAKDPSTLESLESTIARGGADARTWLAYGDQLSVIGRPADAAVAYRKCLDADPHDREAQLRCATALAAANDSAGLSQLLQDLVLSDPKVVVDFSTTPAGAALHSTPPFDAIYRDATSQSMD